MKPRTIARAITSGVMRPPSQDATQGEPCEALAKEGLFVSHRCWKCRDGTLPCRHGNPRQCGYPRARND
jgi:hypothetical protein